jgi:urea carboxylase
MFSKILIANRGAIACRIQRTLARLGIASVAVYSDADRDSLHVRNADEAVWVGAAPAAESYLRSDRILEAALARGAQAIHPGYGFLSENAQFAEDCARAGIVFIGPTPQQMRSFGLKHTARALASEAGLPLVPGSNLLVDLEEAHSEAERVGYPVMLKSTAGGGGIGMQQCNDSSELSLAFDSVRRLAGSNFSDNGVFLERFVARARHIEVQLFGDGAGHVVALGERDCSSQRRNQKVVEETPAPGLSIGLRTALSAAAVRLGKAVQYQSAGTVEFIVDADRAAHESAADSAYYFLEVNTRLQVEHGVTEAVTGIDLVEWMLRVAANDLPDLSAYRHEPKGVSIQARLYAEDPARGFRPSSGLLSEVVLPDSLRVDSWIEAGSEVSQYYDPMLGKLIAHADTRELAISQLDAALKHTSVYGVETNRDYLRAIITSDVFRAAEHTTSWLGTLPFKSRSIECLQPGTHTTVQDWPGRLNYWAVGVPPSGPMDALALRLANRLVGNTSERAALEITATGPTLKFGFGGVMALAGAPMKAKLDGKPIEFWQAIEFSGGSVLQIGALEGHGQRAYLALRGGFEVPNYMGSRATFTLGQFGGHVGRNLRVGDVLHIGTSRQGDDQIARSALPELSRPKYSTHWDIAVLYGPHSAPDFFTGEDIQTFFQTDWRVHYNSSRTGVRLIGPKPQWARRDGGEAGLHPSNIHDNAYAIGAIDFTGDMPVILGPDGPSLGGFVCPATVALSDQWKIGQLQPGNTIRFHAISASTARDLLNLQDQSIEQLQQAQAVAEHDHGVVQLRAILEKHAAQGSRPQICYRQSGEDNILIEYGEPRLDIALRFRVQALLDALNERRLPGIIDLTPGIRSLQVHFDSRTVNRRLLLRELQRLEDSLPAIEDLEVSSRIVHLPLSWDDPATQLAVDRYMQSVRADAPWCPSNIEFIRRINGLQRVEDVRQIVFEASYLVMGLGDVYLGAPVATPLDPRHRLVTTKYNPARTWTPENAVGIGGAYLCVYGMEGPGGYQFVGRTIQMWNRYRQSTEFKEGKRWLLRFFDQLRFYPVSAPELEQLRGDFLYGKVGLQIETASLRLRDYQQFLTDNADSIQDFKSRQQAAFEAEREHWRTIGNNHTAERTENSEAPAEIGESAASASPSQELPPDCVAICSPVSGSVWKVVARVGDLVAERGTLLVVEAMKMEIALQAEQAGIVVELRCRQGQAVAAGETLLVLRPRTEAP